MSFTDGHQFRKTVVSSGAFVVETYYKAFSCFWLCMDNLKTFVAINTGLSKGVTIDL